MSKHTQGKWKVEFHDKEDGTYYIEDDLGHSICDILSGFYNAEANAHLIALAPELLEALKEFVDLCERDDSPYSTMGKYAHPFSETGQKHREKALKIIKQIEGNK